MRHVFFFLFISFIFASCREPSKERPFHKYGVSFTIPAGWIGVDEEDLGGGYTISVEKEGMDASGMVNISWVDIEIELDEWALEIRDDLASNLNTAVSKTSFSGIKDGTYNGIPTRCMTYKATFLGVKHTGTIHVFHKSGKSFGIIIQEAIEDKGENEDGFRVVESSFQVS